MIKGKVPLDRALSKLGIASRSQARQWILDGRLKVNGMIRRDPGFYVAPETARFELDGKRLERPSFLAVALNKPKGVITTHSDEKGRPTVYSLLRLAPDEFAGLHAVGRLDQATSGLLILTNNTRLSSWLTDPENRIERVYLVTVRGEVTSDELDRMCQGVESEGDLFRADRAELRKASRRESHLTVVLTEGKNREIRRLMLALGHEVTRLKRVSYGGLELGELAPGTYRELKVEELRRLFPECEFLARVQEK